MIFRCQCCGAKLNIFDSNHKLLNIVKCPSCNMYQTIPVVSDDEITERYNEANRLKREARFNEAIQEFKKIAEARKLDSDAFFSIALCRYNLEYLYEQSKHSAKLICHKILAKKFTADEDFKRALVIAQKNNNMEKYDYYLKEGAKINELIKHLIEESQNGDRYDIFISTKIKDKSYQLTEDSEIAERLYTDLTNMGFKVFLSTHSLKNHAGERYEPIIYNALRNSRLMLVIATSIENIKAQWVENEWSRYIELLSSNNQDKRFLVPCYKGFDGSELPGELYPYQGVDMAPEGGYDAILDIVEDRLGKRNKRSRKGFLKVAESLSDFEIEANKYIRKIQLAFSFKGYANKDITNVADNYLDKVAIENKEFINSLQKIEVGTRCKLIRGRYYFLKKCPDKAYEIFKTLDDSASQVIDLPSLKGSCTRKKNNDEKFHDELEPFYAKGNVYSSNNNYKGALEAFSKCALGNTGFKKAPKRATDFYKDSYLRYLENRYCFKKIAEIAKASFAMNSNYYAFKLFDSIQSVPTASAYVAMLVTKAEKEILDYGRFLFNNERFKLANECLAYLADRPEAQKIMLQSAINIKKGNDCSKENEKYIFDLFERSGVIQEKEPYTAFDILKEDDGNES